MPAQMRKSSHLPGMIGVLLSAGPFFIHFSMLLTAYGSSAVRKRFVLLVDLAASGGQIHKQQMAG